MSLVKRRKMSEVSSSMECLHPSLSERGAAEIEDVENNIEEVINDRRRSDEEGDLGTSNEPPQVIKPPDQISSVNNNSKEEVVMEINTSSDGKKDVADEEHDNFHDDCNSLSSDDLEIITGDYVNDITVKPGPSNSTATSSSAACQYYSAVLNKSYASDPKLLQQMVVDNVALQKVLFKNHFVEPISFLLLLHDFSLELKLTKVIEDCGGVVYSSVRDIDGFTAVLVKDDSLHWAYTGPVFKVSYISACIEAGKILDIAAFFKSSVKKTFTKDFDFMRVVYFKKISWDGVKSNTPTKVYNKSINGSNGDQIEVCIISDSDEDVPLKVDDTKGDGGGVVVKSVNKHTRFPYTRKEEENIVKCIINKKCYDAVKGNQIWKDFERKNICPHRTWQSMKEHFRKKIIYNLDAFKFLTDKQKYNLQAIYM